MVDMAKEMEGNFTKKVNTTANRFKLYLRSERLLPLLFLAGIIFYILRNYLVNIHVN